MRKRPTELYKAITILLLGSPDSRLKRIFTEAGLDADGHSFEEFIRYVQRERDESPDFLEPVGPNNPEQLHIESSGGTYAMAQLTARMSGSYLFTDLRARWAMIEHDRSQHSAEIKAWAPFAKVVQNTKLHYLNNLGLQHALTLRREKRLERVRSFMTEVWGKTRGDQPFDEENAIHFANTFQARVGEAEGEWEAIKAEVMKFGAAGVTAAIATAGAAIATGGAAWFAATAVTAAGTIGWTKMKSSSFKYKNPAAFFMDLPDE